MPRKYVPKTKKEQALELQSKRKAHKGMVDTFESHKLPKDTLTREEYYRYRS